MIKKASFEIKEAFFYYKYINFFRNFKKFLMKIMKYEKQFVILHIINI